ncbi:MAG: DUF4013 domain-containing protein [Chloroflexi bacterium]|nr:DUF4013 domain-containing protein [Chloroflexota bacterium]
MFSGTDLSQILLFPVKDSEARKYFLIGCAVALAGFIVPIIPYLLLFGYAVQIAKQVLNGESPRMVKWDDWGRLLQDGARMFGVRMAYSLPLLILVLPMMIAGIALPIIADNANGSEVEAFIAIFGLVMFSLLCLIMLLSLPLALIIPAAEMHAVEKNEFAAGFRFREWWGILRANLGGFIVALVIVYVASMALTIVMQILMATIILSCLLPFFVPAITTYTTLVMYAMFAQAYKVGRDKLAETANAPIVS